MLIAKILVNLFGFLVFLFIFWKKMRDDFGGEVIFRTAFFLTLGFSMFYFLSLNFAPDWFLWFCFGGGILGLIFAVFSQRVRFYETLEAFVVSTLPWVSLIFLHDSVVKSSLSSFIAFVVVLFLMFGSYYLDANYKSFTWYKSGKIGISGLVILSVIFLVRSIVAFFEINMLSFVGDLEIVVSGISFLISLVMIYLLTKHE